jgi:hypothetical protein
LIFIDVPSRNKVSSGPDDHEVLVPMYDYLHLPVVNHVVCSKFSLYIHYEFGRAVEIDNALAEDSWQSMF